MMLRRSTIIYSIITFAAISYLVLIQTSSSPQNAVCITNSNISATAPPPHPTIIQTVTPPPQIIPRLVRSKTIKIHPSSDSIICQVDDNVNVECPFKAQSQEDRQIMLHMFATFNLTSLKNDGGGAGYYDFPLTGPTNVILEIGAFNGISFSTSFIFEEMLDWKAIHFEGARNNFKELVANRPKSTNLQLAACATEQKVKFIDAGGVGGVESMMSEKFKSIYHKNMAEELTYEVDCVPLSKTISMLGIERIEIFVLDTEGNELEVLLGIDLKVTKVHYFIIEEDHTNVKKEETIRQILRDNGFKFHGTIGLGGGNGLYENTNWS